MDRSFDLVLLTRFLAICAGAVTAYVLRSELAIGYSAMGIVATSASLNFAVYCLSPTRFSDFRRRVSPIVGLGCWAALMSVTGGINSPFIAGLSMEIVLSTVALSPRGVLLVTVGATAALVAQQALDGYDGAIYALVLQGAFLCAIGLATAWITKRWSRTRDEIVSQSEELGTRLDSLERELEDERTLSQMGERVARLAHGLKNAVHSLRGFASLIEAKLAGDSGREALDGLRAAIDDLEALARLTLDADVDEFAAASRRGAGESGTAEDSPGSLTPAPSGVSLAIDRALSEMNVSQPEVEWTLIRDGSTPQVEMPTDAIAEALLILMRNATDAMGGQGAGTLEVGCADGQVRIVVRDKGCGIPQEVIEQIFTPGYTTKPGGSGFGLFLARRLVEEHGGQLRVEAAPEGGAVAEMALPVGGESAGAGESQSASPNAKLARA